MVRIGVDAKAYYKSKVTATVVEDEIEDAIDNECEKMWIFAPNFTRGARRIADSCEEVEVHLTEWVP